MLPGIIENMRSAWKKVRLQLLGYQFGSYLDTEIIYLCATEIFLDHYPDVKRSQIRISILQIPEKGGPRVIEQKRQTYTNFQHQARRLLGRTSATGTHNTGHLI